MKGKKRDISLRKKREKEKKERMNFSLLNKVTVEHFASFSRADNHDRRVSVVQSTRFLLSLMKEKLLIDYKNFEKGEDLKSIDELFGVIDTSLCFLVTREDYYSHASVSMRSDFKEDIEDELKIENQVEKGSDDTSSYSLNSLSLVTPDRKRRGPNLLDLKEKEKSGGSREKEESREERSESREKEESEKMKGKEEESGEEKKREKREKKKKGEREESDDSDTSDEENDIFSIKRKEEEGLQVLFSFGDRNNYNIDFFRENFGRCPDELDRYLVFLKSLEREKKIIVNAPVKLFQMMMYHLTVFLSRENFDREIRRCENYRFLIDNDCIPILSRFFFP